MEGFMAARALRGAASAASEVGARPRRRRLVARGGGGAGAPTVSVVAGAPTERSTRPRPRPRASGSDRRRNRSPRRPRLRRRASDSARLLHHRPPGRRVGGSSKTITATSAERSGLAISGSASLREGPSRPGRQIPPTPSAFRPQAALRSRPAALAAAEGQEPRKPSGRPLAASRLQRPSGPAPPRLTPSGRGRGRPNSPV